MFITYRGVSQFDIAESIERMGLRLQSFDIGPMTNSTAAFWLSEEGPVAKIRKAGTKEEIKAALKMSADNSGHNVSDWLETALTKILPNACQSMNPRTQSEVLDEIGAVHAWNGFYDVGGRFHVMTAKDHEINDYLHDKLGIDPLRGHAFNQNLFNIIKGPYSTYQLYAHGDAGAAMADIEAFASANDLDDECGGTRNGDGTFYATAGFAQKVLDEIDSIQALGHKGQLMVRQSRSPAPKPKR